MTATASTTATSKRPRKRAKADGPKSVGELIGEALGGKAQPAEATNGHAKPAKEKRERLKQKELPGMERPKIKELEDAAFELRDVRSERQALTAKEVELAERISGLMKEHKLKSYRLDGDSEVVILPSEFKVKVRKIKEPKDPSKLPVKE